jgi:hypothetical protein
MPPQPSPTPDFLAPLLAVARVRAAWVGRVDGIEVAVGRDEALQRLRAAHAEVVAATGIAAGDWWRPEQVHGVAVAVVPGAVRVAGPDGLPVVPGVDGLVTAAAAVLLGVYVADCGPVWLADRGSGAVGLVHSGRTGTEGGIVTRAIRRMQSEFGSRPADLVVVLGPCIRPPHYEVDFAAAIVAQARAAGVREVHDCGCDTAQDPGCYSYRMERGRTGRMLALVWRE